MLQVGARARRTGLVQKKKNIYLNFLTTQRYNTVPFSILKLYAKTLTCFGFVYKVRPVSSTKTNIVVSKEVLNYEEVYSTFKTTFCQLIQIYRTKQQSLCNLHYTLMLLELIQCTQGILNFINQFIKKSGTAPVGPDYRSSARNRSSPFSIFVLVVIKSSISFDCLYFCVSIAISNPYPNIILMGRNFIVTYTLSTLVIPFTKIIITILSKRNVNG